MSSQIQKFILVGPHQGKTMLVNGHEFVEGEYTFAGSHEQISTLTNIFSNYAAVPADQVELAQLRAERAAAQADSTAEVSAVTAADMAEVKQLALDSKAESVEQLRDAAGDNQAHQTIINLSEAIGALDPETDVHWTSNNLPSLEHLSTLLGKKVARGEVDAVAEGYTRAKARSARAS